MAILLRFDTIITIVQKVEPKRLPNGNHTSAEKELGKLRANVSYTNYETSERIYGEVKEGSRTVRLQHKITDPFDYMIIDGGRFTVDSVRHSRHRASYIVSEVV